MLDRVGMAAAGHQALSIRASAPESLPASLEVVELVEGGARGRQQDDLAGARRGARGGDRAAERRAVVQRRGACERRVQRGRLGADQVDAGAVLGDRVAQRRVVLALARPPIIAWTSTSKDASATSAAATLVALESLT